MAKSRSSQLSRLVSVAVDEGLAMRKPLAKPPDSPPPATVPDSAGGLIIDCSVPAWCPDGWTIRPEDQLPGRVRDEQFSWDPAKISLRLDEGQRGCYIGTKLVLDLVNQPVLPANVLDHLLDNTTLIPESWRGQYVFFWGTIYRNNFGVLCVRFLYRLGRQWDCRDRWLDGGWGSDDPAALAR